MDEIESSCYPGIQLHPDLINLFLLLFADDVVLMSYTIRGLQNQINVLEQYCCKYDLHVNLDKTKVVGNYYVLPTLDKFYCLTSNDKTNVIHNLAMYIEKCMQLRSRLLSIT